MPWSQALIQPRQEFPSTRPAGGQAMRALDGVAQASRLVALLQAFATLCAGPVCSWPIAHSAGRIAWQSESASLVPIGELVNGWAASEETSMRMPPHAICEPIFKIAIPVRRESVLQWFWGCLNQGSVGT